ncbi:MAG TPA: alpha/beta hydrolase, partial [Anaerolineales bacterium]|nr:alpha/beta hydrolase [Anaerolineales bacterium]
LYHERAKAWPVASGTRLIETPSGQTFCRISGRPADPPLVLLPGARSTSLTWIPNISALSTHYRTYALDSIYDIGLSVSRQKIKKPDDLVTWLDEVLAALVSKGSLRLMGLSYGGWLASLYALRFPERVQKLVILTPAATVLPVSLTLIFRALLTLLPFGNFRQKFYYWLLQDSVQSGETGQAFVDEAVADWSTAERCFRRLPMVPATVLEDEVLHGFKVPTLFLVGENEKVYSAQSAVSRLNRVAPQIKTGIIPQAGHDLWFIQASLVNKMILDFLGEPEIGMSSS